MDEAFLRKLQMNLNDGPASNESVRSTPDVIEIHPKPEWCLKVKTVHGNKVFVNICSCEKISAPRLLADHELSEIIENPASQALYRLPMSIGELHAEVDRVGGGCVACDVVIHPALVTRMKTSALYHSFFITLALQGVQQKHSLEEFHQEYIILKNKHYLGSMPAHFIRAVSRPAIIDMSENAAPLAPVQRENNTESDTSHTKSTNGETPVFQITQIPVKGHPEFLVAEIQLPKLKSSRGVELDVGEDRLVLGTRSATYTMDIYLPFTMVPDESRAEFNRKTKVLTVTIPVAPQH